MGEIKAKLEIARKLLLDLAAKAATLQEILEDINEDLKKFGESL